MAQATDRTSAKKAPANSATRRQAGKSDAASKIRIKWTRSAIAAPEKHKRVIKGLGFTRLNQVVEREDTPSIRGMVQAVPHLVQIVD
jgi:large subunit ribosomal protein L30